MVTGPQAAIADQLLGGREAGNIPDRRQDDHRRDHAQSRQLEQVDHLVRPGSLLAQAAPVRRLPPGGTSLWRCNTPCRRLPAGVRWAMSRRRWATRARNSRTAGGRTQTSGTRFATNSRTRMKVSRVWVLTRAGAIRRTLRVLATVTEATYGVSRSTNTQVLVLISRTTLSVGCRCLRAQAGKSGSATRRGAS